MLNNYSADQSGAGREAMERPAAVLSGRTLDADDPGWFPRRERNVEAIERMGKALAERLDERFLARPAIEEAERPVARIEGEVRLVLAARKKTRRNVVRVADDANGFDVDPDLAFRCEGEHGDIFGVRYVEAQVRPCETPRERGFAMGAVRQLDGFRLHAESCREQLAQPRPRDDKSAPVTVEHETTRSLSLRVGEQRCQCTNGFRPGVQRSRHDFNCVVRE